MFESIIQREIRKVVERMTTDEKLDQATQAIRKSIVAEIGRLTADGSLDTAIFSVLMTMRAAALEITGEEIKDP